MNVKNILKTSMIILSFNILWFSNIVNAVNTNLIDIEKHWAEENIIELVERGIISGYSDGRFKPENEITTIEFLKMLIEAGDYNLIRSGDCVYPDFYLETAIYRNLISKEKCSDLNKLMTRYEMVEIISRFVNISEVKENRNIFKDLNDESKENVLKLVKLKIINGYEDKTFKGENAVTRAEAATVILKILDARDKIILQQKYDISKRKDLSNYIGGTESSVKTFYEVKNDEILIYDSGRYAKLNAYKVSGENIDLSKIINIIKTLVNENGYVAVMYVPSQYTINELKICYGKNELNSLCGKYDFLFNYYENSTYKLSSKSLNKVFSDNCYMRIDIVDVYNDNFVDEFKKEKLLDCLKIEFGNNSTRILNYILNKSRDYEKNVGREQEHFDKKIFGKYIVNYYQKEDGIPQFYIERK